MKSRMKTMTLDALRAIYDDGSVIEFGTGYSLYLFGCRLTLDVPCVGMPLAADGSVVDFREGFNMPEVIKTLHLNRGACQDRVLFLRDIRTFKDYECSSCQAMICDPEDADSILLISDYVFKTSRMSEIAWFNDDCIWQIAIRTPSFDLKSINQRYYEVFPLDDCFLRANNGKAEGCDMLREQVVRAANQYLAF